MRILFLQRLTYPFIGVMSLSAVLKRNGHDTRLQLMDLKRPRQRDIDSIAAFDPQIVAFPVYSGWQKGVVSFCRIIKKRLNCITILGGPHPTHCPEIVEDEAVDFICVGEGESSFLEMANRLQQGLSTDDIPGIWYTRNGTTIDNGPSVLPVLAELPPMDIDLYCEASEAIRKQENREFSLNRGCPYQCTYCNGPSLKMLYGPQVLRSKTVEQAMEEIHYVYDRYPFKSAAFTSDNFYLNKEFASEFLDRYRQELGLPFWCQMRVELVDEDIARLLKEAGCHMVSVGIESGSLRVRKEILGRHMSNDRIKNACRILKDHGLGVNSYNMVGIPGETFEEALETIHLNSEIAPTSSWCSYFQPYPGSKLTQSLLKEGVISPEVFDDLPASFFDRSIILTKDAHVWANLQRLFQLWVLHPRLDRLFRAMCKVKLPRLYDAFFLWSFYRYVRIAYKKTPSEALSRVLTNALEALKA